MWLWGLRCRWLLSWRALSVINLHGLNSCTTWPWMGLFIMRKSHQTFLTWLLDSLCHEVVVLCLRWQSRILSTLWILMMSLLVSIININLLTCNICHCSRQVLVAWCSILSYSLTSLVLFVCHYERLTLTSCSKDRCNILPWVHSFLVE